MKTPQLTDLETRAQALESTGDTDAAVALWQSAAATDDDPRLHLRLGLALSRAGRRADALAHFERAVADPTGSPVWAALARARLDRHDNEGALLAARLGATLPGADSSAIGAWALALHANGRLESALAQAIDLAEVSPDDPEALALEAQLRLMRGEAAEALPRAEALTTRFPDFAVGWHLLGNAREATGDAPGAVDALRRALTLDPRLAPAAESLGLALRDQGRLDEAEAAWRAGLTQAPRAGRLHTRLADLYAHRLNRPDAALAEARAGAALEPDDPEVLMTHGVVAAFAGQREEARGVFERLATDPRQPHWAHEVAGRKLDALGEDMR
jgi:protein O-GlcNAc transferase